MGMGVVEMHCLSLSSKKEFILQLEGMPPNDSAFGISHGIQAFFPSGSWHITEHGGVLGPGHLCLWNSSTGQSFLQQTLSNWPGLCGPVSQPEAHLPSPVFLLLSFYRKGSAE